MDDGGDDMGEGVETSVGCGGTNEGVDGGRGWLEEAEGTDELGVWDGLLRLSSLMTELMDGTRAWTGGGGERSSWRVMVDEEEEALDWACGRRGDEGKGARAGDGRGCRRRKVDDFFVVVVVVVSGGSGVEEEEAEEDGGGESGCLCFPLVVGGMSGGGGSGGGGSESVDGGETASRTR